MLTCVLNYQLKFIIMKKVSIIIIASLFSLLSNAQDLKYGVHAGVNLSGYCSGDKFKVYDSKFRTGCQVGGDLIYTFNNKITLSSGADIMLSGGKFSTFSSYISSNGVNTEFPEIKAKEISVEIPIKIGYDFKLSDKSDFIPSVGIYGRYGFESIKDNVTTSLDNGKSQDVKKWNCYEDFSDKGHRIDAFKRFDFGVNAEARFVFSNHYFVALGYSYGLTKKTEQYGIKPNYVKLSLGYIF